MRKYKYLIPASVLSFSVLLSIYGLGSSIFIQHNWCVLGLPPITSGLLYFFGTLFRLVSPFMYLYVALMFFYLASKPEKENKLTRIALYLTIFLLVIQFSAYIPFVGRFIQILVYSNFFSVIYFFIPIVVFLLLLVSNFNKHYFTICLVLAILILGGIKISENRHGCSAGIGNTRNSAKFEEAVKNNNEEQCSGLIPEQKQYCYSKIALSKNDSSICGKMGEETGMGILQKNGCYSTIAKNTNNFQTCNPMVHEIKADGVEAKDFCYSDVAKNTGSIEACALISSLRQKDICISNVAQVTKDLKTCNLASSSDLPFKDRCISGIAKTNKDLKICDLITNPNEKRYCVSGVATVTNNCGLMKQYGDVFYNSCLELAEQYKNNPF